MISSLFPPADYKCEDVNEYSQILRLEYDGLSVMLTGDATTESEAEVLKRFMSGGGTGHVDILKAAHHGSHTSNSEEWLEALDPAITVISCGRNNRYGHPSDEVLRRFDAAGIEIRRTDLEGAICIK